MLVRSRDGSAPRRYGLKHASTAAAYNNLGEAFHALGEHDDAAAAFAYALRIAHEARRGRPFHPAEPREAFAAVAAPLRNLALHLFARGDVAAALPLFEHLLELYETLHDPRLSPDGDDGVAAAAAFLGVEAPVIESPALVPVLLVYTRTERRSGLDVATYVKRLTLRRTSRD